MGLFEQLFARSTVPDTESAGVSAFYGAFAVVAFALNFQTFLYQAFATIARANEPAIDLQVAIHELKLSCKQAAIQNTSGRKLPAHCLLLWSFDKDWYSRHQVVTLPKLAL